MSIKRVTVIWKLRLVLTVVDLDHHRKLTLGVSTFSDDRS